MERCAKCDKELGFHCTQVWDTGAGLVVLAAEEGGNTESIDRASQVLMEGGVEPRKVCTSCLKDWLLRFVTGVRRVIEFAEFLESIDPRRLVDSVELEEVGEREESW